MAKLTSGDPDGLTALGQRQPSHPRGEEEPILTPVTGRADFTLGCHRVWPAALGFVGGEGSGLNSRSDKEKRGFMAKLQSGGQWMKNQ